MRCSEIHGFNYDGSRGTSALDLWQHHDNGTMAVEIARGKGHFPRWNVCRWWLSQEAFQRDPVCDFGGVALEHIVPGLSFGEVIEDLFAHLANVRPRRPALIEQVLREYLEAVVGSHKDDQRIFAWDLCNEPLMARYVDDPASETVWGAVDDEKHVEIMRHTLGELRKRRIGFTVHALQHSLVADLHYAAYGPVGHPEVLHFVSPDGSLRRGHEAFNDFC